MFITKFDLCKLFMALSLYFKPLLNEVACVNTISTWSCLLRSVSFIYLLYRCPQVVHYKQYWELRCDDNIIMNVTEACFCTDIHLHWEFLVIVFWAWFIYLWYNEQHCHMLRLHSIKLWDGYWILNLKGCGRKVLWPGIRHYHTICLAGLRKTT